MSSKFPVTSDKEQYLVKFDESTFDARYFSFRLYKKKNFYGFKRMKRVASIQLFGEDWNYNFVEMANYLVLEYEFQLEKRNNTKKTMQQEIESFEKWDGNMN